MKEDEPFNLANKFLIATPELDDSHFHRSVIYICAHSEDGAMGLMINHPLLDMNLNDVFSEMQIEADKDLPLSSTVLLGGPLQPDRGFVLHKPLQSWQSTLIVCDAVAVTSSQDILQAMARNEGPKEAFVILGYSGWTNDILEKELLENDWLVAPATVDIIFETPLSERWQAAIKSLGFNADNLSGSVGHA